MKSEPPTQPDVLLADPVAVVEALEALQVLGFDGAERGDVDAAEAEANADRLLQVSRARRAGYVARRQGANGLTCPFRPEGEALEVRCRAAWLSGWMLRELAERARSGERTPAPAELLGGDGPNLLRFPFFREMNHFGQLAARWKLRARIWKHAARAFFSILRAEPKDPSWQRSILRKMSTALAEAFLAAGASHRVEWGTTFDDPRVGSLTLTLERVDGKSPVALIAEANARAAAADEELMRGRDQLAEAKARATAAEEELTRLRRPKAGKGASSRGKG
jgi:hypothetical protein